MGSLPHFLTHVAPLRALRARELRYNYFIFNVLGSTDILSFPPKLISLIPLQRGKISPEMRPLFLWYQLRKGLLTPPHELENLR